MTPTYKEILMDTKKEWDKVEKAAGLLLKMGDVNHMRPKRLKKI